LNATNGFRGSDDETKHDQLIHKETYESDPGPPRNVENQQSTEDVADPDKIRDHRHKDTPLDEMDLCELRLEVLVPKDQIKADGSKPVVPTLVLRDRLDIPALKY
jgi:hypothetical protein